MTRDDIIRMAKEAELHCHMNIEEHSLAIEDLEHFAALVRDNYNNKHSQLWQVCVEEVVEAEREACAKAAGPEDSYRDEWFNAKADSVKRILARSNT
jgi:hypothetical protein